MRNFASRSSVRPSDSAVRYVVGKLKEKPHQTRLYFSYISTFVRFHQDVVDELEELVSDEAVSDYQRMFLLATLLRAPTIKRATVNIALQWLQNPRVAMETRAMAAIFAAKKWNGATETQCPHVLPG